MRYINSEDGVVMIIFLLVTVLMENCLAVEETRSLVDQVTKNIVPSEQDLLNADSGDQMLLCPTTWFIKSNSTCHCGSDLRGIVECDPITRQVAVLDCHCLTFDTTSGATSFVGNCIFNCGNFTHKNNDLLYHRAPSNCTGLHRKGVLCGQCMEGYKVPAYSYNFTCIRCNNQLQSWGRYVIFAFLPHTIFIMIVFVFRINALSPTLYYPIFIAQTISSPALLRVVMNYVSHTRGTIVFVFAVMIMTLNGVWNLDFLRVNVLPQICINTSPLQILVLDYLVAIYPMLLMAVAYLMAEIYEFGPRPVVWIWKPFHRFFARFRRQWGIQSTIMDTFATFFYLSTTKLLSVSFSLLMATPLYTSDGKLHSWRMYYDPNIHYFGNEHLPYALLAIGILTVFILLPVFLFYFYELKPVKKCLTSCKIRSSTLDNFVSKFQKYYQDGSNGTRDCRWFAGVIITTKLLGYVIYAFVPGDIFSIFSTMLLIICLAIFIAVEPYKENVYNIINGNILAILALFYACIVYGSTANIVSRNMRDSFACASILSLVPTVYFIGVFLYHIMGMLRKKTTQLISSLPHRMLYPDQYQPLQSQ